MNHETIVIYDQEAERIEKVRRLLTPVKGSPTRKYRKEEPPPHAVRDVPVDVYREWEIVDRPKGLPSGDTQMPRDLENVLSELRHDTMVRGGLWKVKKDLEKVVIETSPRRPRPEILAELLPPIVDESLTDIKSVPLAESPQTGNRHLPGHLYNNLSQTKINKVINDSPERSRIPSINEVVVRNPRHWTMGTQDGHGRGCVLKVDPQWVWVRWNATGDGCYRHSQVQPLTTPPTYHTPPAPKEKSELPLTEGQLQVLKEAAMLIHPSPPPHKVPASPTTQAPKHHLQCGCHAVVIPSDHPHTPFRGHPQYIPDGETLRADIVDRVAAMMAQRQRDNYPIGLPSSTAPDQGDGASARVQRSSVAKRRGVVVEPPVRELRAKGADDGWADKMVWIIPLMLGILGFAALARYEQVHTEDKHLLRTTNIEAFNDSVRVWEAAYADFQTLKPSVARLSLSEDVLDIPPDTAEERFSDKSNDFAQYHPLKYKISAPLMTEANSWEELTVNGVQFPPIEGVPSEVVLSMSNTINLGNWKQCHYGRKGAYQIKGNHTCTVHYKLRSVCLLTEKVGKQWVYKGGCHDNGDMLSYEVASCSRDAPPRLLYISTVSVTVRHAADPFLLAKKLTNGKLHFGESRAESRRVTTVLYTISIVLLGVFFAIAVAQADYMQTCQFLCPPPVAEKLSPSAGGSHVSIEMGER